ncbi:MAG: rsbP 2 [Phycisphaerales bacterium]|nr:rsbP 2 [Phycisphaerales bacterium]
MLSRRLQRDGYVVGVAADGPAALAAIARDPFDVVLLDVEMPGMTGFDVLKEVRRTRSPAELPVLIATARNDRQDILTALGLGANDFVTKPLDFAVVSARVRTQLGHKRAVDRGAALAADLVRRNADLERANGRMRQSLDMASRVQRSLLPAGPLRVPGLSFAWVYEPCDELGGDTLNIFPLGPDHVGFYLLDVSGHGVPSALMAVTLSRMLAAVPGQPSLVERVGAAGPEPRPPVDVVNELNRRFQMASATGAQYFTLFYGVLDVPGRQLRYVSAGHPPALYLPAGGTPRWLEDPSFAVGWFADPEYEERTLALAPGDRLFVYSDGCTETLDPAVNQFGTARMAAACCDARGAALQGTLDLLLQRMAGHRGGGAADDDISALAVEVGG